MGRIATIATVLVLIGVGSWIYSDMMAPAPGSSAPPPEPGPAHTPAPAAAVAEAVAWPPLPAAPLALADNLVAVNYLVLLDTSGSMQKSECSGDRSKFDAARDALRGFAASLGAADRYAVAVFKGTGARLVLPFGSGDGQRRQLDRVLSELSPDGATPLHGAIDQSYQWLTEQAQRQAGYGTYRLVVITDGYSTDKDPKDLAMAVVCRSAVEVHAIGFCIGGGHALNIPGYTSYYTANSPQQLAAGLAAVRAEVESFDATRLTEGQR